MISMLSPVSTIVIWDQENEAMTTKSSPTRLMVGGKAILVRFAVNHQKVISGSRV